MLTNPLQMSELLSSEEVMRRLREEEPKPAPAASAQDSAEGGTTGSKEGAQQQQSVAAPTPAPAAKPDLDQLSDEEIEALLQKRGKKVVPAAQDKQPTEKELREKRDADKLTFGLQKGLFKKEDYDKYQADKARGVRQTVFAQFVEDNKDSEQSIEQLEARFRQLYHEDADDEYSYLREARQKDMEREYERILKNRYPEIHRLDKKFDEHLAQEQTTARQQAERQQQEQAYRATIEDIFSGLNKFPVQVKEDDDSYETFDFQLPADILNELKTQFLTEGQVEQLRSLPKEKVKKAIDLAVLDLTQGKLVSYIARAYHSKKSQDKAIGRKHMNPEEVHGTAVIERDAQAYEMVKDFVPAAEVELASKGKQ